MSYGIIKCQSVTLTSHRPDHELFYLAASFPDLKQFTILACPGFASVNQALHAEPIGEGLVRKIW